MHIHILLTSASMLHCKPRFTIAGPRSHRSILLHADLLTWVCSMSCIHTAKKIGLGLESEQDLGSDPLLQQRARTQVLYVC